MSTETTMEVTKPIGTIHPKQTMVLRVHIGTMKTDEFDFTLSTAMAGMPLVYCNKTDRYFSLSWQEICELAIEAGLGKDGS